MGKDNVLCALKPVVIGQIISEKMLIMLQLPFGPGFNMSSALPFTTSSIDYLSCNASLFFSAWNCDFFLLFDFTCALYTLTIE